MTTKNAKILDACPAMGPFDGSIRKVGSRIATPLRHVPLVGT